MYMKVMTLMCVYHNIYVIVTAIHQLTVMRSFDYDRHQN